MKAIALFSGACVGLFVQRLFRSASRSSRTRVWLIRHGQSIFNKAVDAFFEQNPRMKVEHDADPNSWWEQVSVLCAHHEIMPF